MTRAGLSMVKSFEVMVTSFEAMVKSVDATLHKPHKRSVGFTGGVSVGIRK